MEEPEEAIGKRRRAPSAKGKAAVTEAAAIKEAASVTKDTGKQDSGSGQGKQPAQRAPRKSSIYRAFADSFVESDYARVYRTTSKRRAMLDKDARRSESSSAVPSAEKSAVNSPKEATPSASKSRRDRKSQADEDAHARPGEERGGQASRKPPLSKSKRTPAATEEPARSRAAGKSAGKGGNRRGQRNYMGVQATPSGRFKAKIYVPRTKKHIYIGIYDTPEEAAHAYDEVAYRKRGATAPLNFPESFHENLKAKQSIKKVLIQLTDAGDFEAMCYDPKLKDYHSVGVFSSVDAARRAGAREAATLESSNSEVSGKEDGESWSAKLDSTSESRPMKGKRSKPGNTSPPVGPDLDDDASDDEDIPVPDDQLQKTSRSMRSKKGTFTKSSASKKASKRANMTRRADFRGVYCNGQKFQSIYYNPATKKHTYLGTFRTAEEAARAHDQVGYGQFGEEAKLNLPEEIETLRSTVKVVGNNIIMGLAGARPSSSKAKAAKGDGEEDDDDEEEDEDEGPDSPFSSPIVGRGNLGVLIDGMKSDEDDEPDSPSSSEAPSSSYETRARSNNINPLQPNSSDTTLKNSNSDEGKGSEKPSAGTKHNSTDNLKISEGASRANEGLGGAADVEEKSGRRVSRRKAYRASRIDIPLLKGALEEVVRLSLEEDKVTERQRETEPVEEEKKPQDGSKMQRRARKPTPPLKNSLGETASRSLLGKGKSEEEHQAAAAGSAMPSFDVLAEEILKASVLMETEAEADVAEPSTSRGDSALANSADENSNKPSSENVGLAASN